MAVRNGLCKCLGVVWARKLFLIGIFLISYNNAIGQEVANFSKLKKTFSYNSQLIFDSLGYVWISHSDGIYKYDGYDFFFTPYEKIFDGRGTNPRDIIFEKDSKGNFWLATYNGEITRITPKGNYSSFRDSLNTDTELNRISAIYSDENSVLFGASDGSIYQFMYSSSKINKITSVPLQGENETFLQSITVTDDGTIWVSTDSGSIFYNSTKGTNKYHWKLLEGPYRDPIGGVARITSDSNNKIWIASEHKGLFSFNPMNGAFERYSQVDDSDNGNNTLFITIFYDDSGKIWAGTDGNGLYCVDIKTKKLEVFKHERANRFSLSNNTIGEINKDTHGNIWVATKNGNIDVLPYNNKNITLYSGSEDGAPATILSILVSKDGSLWIGTDGEGLNKVSKDGSNVQFKNEKKNDNYFEGRYINGLVEDSQNNIWIATFLNGLYVLNLDNLKFNKVAVVDNYGNPLANIRFVFKDSKKRIWISSKVGIHIFSENKEQLAMFRYGSHGIFGDSSQSIAETLDGTVWVGVNGGGLFKFIEKNNMLSESTFSQVDCNTAGSESAIGLGATKLLSDQNGNLLFKSAFGSLISLDTGTNICESLSQKKGFGNINVQSLLIDNSKKLWIGGLFGLHEYSIEDDLVKSFYVTDGLQGNLYKRGAFKTENGKLFFGGMNGVNAFYPENMLQRRTTPNLYINRIELLNKPAEELIPSQIPNGVGNLELLNLKSYQNSFSFQFSAISNVLNTNYYYGYRLKGFDKEWIVPRAERTATYTNVPSGDYTFEVRAGTKPDVWDIAIKQIQIKVAPPLWFSSLAFIVYFLLISLIGLLIYRWSHLRLKLKREEWAYKNEKEIYAVKMDFFAKMSHEIQTPLALILGPIDAMLQKANINKNRLLVQRLNLIKNNAKRLSRISKDLTTIRNKELNQLKIRASKNNIIDDLKTIALSFAEQARFKNIDFIQKFPEKEVILWYDLDKIEHIFYNLLSNAFKFTPREGTIRLKVANDNRKQRLKISVIDTGPGIPKPELKEIFTLFYQSDVGKKIKGSGIGLALTKELIELHHGHIKAKSSRGQGSSFHVYLSLRDDIFTEDEKLFDLQAVDSQEIKEVSFEKQEEHMPFQKANSGAKIHSILIVEDNIEIQIFLKELFNKKYHISLAENGKEALKLVENNIPDLIISDIMMPVMDGIKMSKTLQGNNRTSHIPIVLLTAKNTTKSKLSGLKSGAVAYINKPFNPQELILRVQSLIQSKENVIANSMTNFISNKKSKLPVSKKHIFLKKLVMTLNEQMENTAFKLEHLSDMMGMSYSVILRNCQEITGKTLVEFFRGLKIKRAALLILERGYNISEAGFIVGYKDSKYFSKCFKEEFGTPPLSMKNESQKIGLPALIKKYNLQSN